MPQSYLFSKRDQTISCPPPPFCSQLVSCIQRKSKKLKTDMYFNTRVIL